MELIDVTTEESRQVIIYPLKPIEIKATIVSILFRIDSLLKNDNFNKRKNNLRNLKRNEVHTNPPVFV